MAKKALEQQWRMDNDQLPIYFLDLLNYRPISNSIAERFAVQHQSPQLILIKDGKAIYNASHSDIDYADIVKVA